MKDCMFVDGSLGAPPLIRLMRIHLRRSCRVVQPPEGRAARGWD
jgi:hypothetical protein